MVDKDMADHVWQALWFQPNTPDWHKAECLWQRRQWEGDTQHQPIKVRTHMKMDIRDGSTDNVRLVVGEILLRGNVYWQAISTVKRLRMKEVHAPVRQQWAIRYLIRRIFFLYNLSFGAAVMTVLRKYDVSDNIGLPARLRDISPARPVSTYHVERRKSMFLLHKSKPGRSCEFWWAEN